MKQGTIVLFAGVLVLIICSAAYFHHQQTEHLHHIHGAISKTDHDRFLRNGIHCEEVYDVQGYEGPETILRMFSLTQHQLRQLNPGVGSETPSGTILCVRGVFGVSTDMTAFHWFWPVAAGACAVAGFVFSMLINKMAATRAARQPAEKAQLPQTGL